MLNYELYDKYILKHTITLTVITLIAASILLFSLIFLIKHKYIFTHKKYVFLVCIILICIIGSAVLASNIITNGIHDINNNAYIIYTGDFTVSYTYHNNKHTIRLDDDNKTVLKINRGKANGGNYKGCLVYAEKTKLVVEINGDVMK